MKSYLVLAAKELREQKVTAALVLIAVILSGMMTSALGGSLGILQTMRREQAASLNGDRYVTFHQLTEEKVLRLKEDARLREVGALINVGNTKLGNSGLTLFLREYLDDALDAYPCNGRLKEGRLPEAASEIALPENVIACLGGKIRVGDVITLRAEASLMSGEIQPYEYAASFTVCGILESNYIGYSTGTVEAVVGEGTAKALLPEDYLLYSVDFKTRDAAQFQSIVDELADSLGMRPSEVQYNWILLDALGISYDEAGASDTDTGFSFLALACVLVGALVLSAAGLVIYNILKIAVAKRIRQYGTLRAIGAEKGQLYRLVSLQLLMLCGLGIPVGLAAGAVCAKGILIAATGVLNPDLFLAESTAELGETIRATGNGSVFPYLVSIVVTLSSAMLAAYPAARYAARVSPTVAMTGQRLKIRRRHRRTGKIRNFEAYYARLNLKRGRGRTAITILSLAMSITVFVALQSFTAVLDTSRSVSEMNPGDYSVTNETTGIDPQSVEEMRENRWVERLSTTMLTTYLPDADGKIAVELDFELQGWEAFHIAGLDEERLFSSVSGLSDTDREALSAGEACIAKNPIAFSYEGKAVDQTKLSEGDEIEVNGQRLRVAGVTDGAATVNNEGYVNGVQILVSEKAYEALTGSGRYSEIYPSLRADADAEEFEEWLDQWCRENSGSHWISYRQTGEQLEDSFQQIRMLCVGLIFLIGLIGILNIVNTVYSNLHTRIAEIGMQRAIGMSAGSLCRTFLWEGAYYGIIASVSGGIAGYVCTVFVNAAMTDVLELVAVPYLSIFAASALSVAACLLATAVPLRAIAGMSIVDSIGAVE